MQAPLQPLQDNLESATYETFEKDTTKYTTYQAAIHAALLDCSPQEGTEHIVIMVVGAGRGPLVTASLQVSALTLTLSQPPYRSVSVLLAGILSCPPCMWARFSHPACNSSRVQSLQHSSATCMHVDCASQQLHIDMRGGCLVTARLYIIVCSSRTPASHASLQCREAAAVVFALTFTENL